MFLILREDMEARSSMTLINPPTSINIEISIEPTPKSSPERPKRYRLHFQVENLILGVETTYIRIINGALITITSIFQPQSLNSIFNRQKQILKYI